MIDNEKRLLSLLLAVVVAVGCCFVYPKKAEASAVIVGEAASVFWTMVASGGAIVGAELSEEEKIRQANEVYGAMSPAAQESYMTWYEMGQRAQLDTGHYVFYPPLEGIDTSWYYDFYDAVVGTFERFVSFKPAVDGYAEFVLSPSTAFGRTALGTCGDAPFFVRTGMGGAYSDNPYANVYAFLPNGTFLSYTWSTKNGVYDVKVKPLTSADTLDISLKISDNGRVLWNVWGADMSSGGPFDLSDGSGFYWGTADLSSRSFYGRPHFKALGFTDGITLGLDELIDADTWAKGWIDALEDAKAGGKEVGIITGKDLGAYNDLESIYHPDTGIITGVRPGVTTPDVPDVGTGDLSGISGKLSDILSKLKALPALIASTVIGTGSLDLSGFKNIKLTGIFPFCIPFDLINCFKSFSGIKAVEPIWTIDFSGTALEAAGKIELDFTQFEDLAKIMRFFCYASVVVGLILLTRNILRS